MRIFKQRAYKPVLRIDDRLVHGQVVVGWAERLGFQRIILANDQIAQNQELSQLYKSLAPAGMEGAVFSLSDTVTYFSQPSDMKGKSMVIVENPAEALNLLNSGLLVSEVIIGGLHHRNGCRELLPYVFLDPGQCAELKEIINLGIKVYCQDLPDNPPLAITEKILE
jgi:mannose/fructose/N-acetylgalactosamine-specific phosphotransferase system component IIB